VKIVADDHARNLQAIDERLANEGFRRVTGKPRVEGHHHRAVEAGRSEQAELGVLGRQPEGRRVRQEKAARMGLEG
jgi:hypothetical protein